MNIRVECSDCGWVGSLDSIVDYDEDGEVIYRCPECDSENVYEVREKEAWETIHVGRKIDSNRAIQNGWFDQGSSNFHFGVTQKENLWTIRIDPANPSCHTVWIFLFVQVDNDFIIQDVSYRIDQVFPDGHGETLQVELFPTDREKAAKELEQILDV